MYRIRKLVYVAICKVGGVLYVLCVCVSGFTHALPWLLVALDVVFLVARTYEVEGSCRKKYGAAWDSYTKRVRCRLIPKVF